MKTLSFVVLMSFAACAPDLRVDHAFDGNGKCADPITKAQVDCSLVPLVSMKAEGAVRTLIVDATNRDSKVYVDLDEGREMKSDEAFETNGWDLAFKRFEISINGGPSSTNGLVRVAVLVEKPFDSVGTAPSDGYLQDSATSVFADVNGGWYYYDLGTHKLTTKDALYIVQTSAGAYVKLRMGSYYDESGTPARISLSYAEVRAP